MPQHLMCKAGLVTCLAYQRKPGSKNCPLWQQRGPGQATGRASGLVAAVSITVSAAAVPCHLALLARVGSLQGKRLEAVVTYLCRKMARFIPT